ncbi:MAG: 6-bladed beta-propeller [Tannerellaceae bacterium]|nr:6-bladed beta-propeller [Tannerellaceae bacterium]
MENLIVFRRLFIGAVFLVFMDCNRGQDKSVDSEIWIVDVTKNYPIQGIDLEDIAEIEYICPQTDENFLYKYAPRCITDEYVVFYDNRGGNVVTFDREGNPVLRFNKKGGGPGEYSAIFDLFYDSDRCEYFLLDYEKIQVDSREGEFRRRLSLKKGVILLDMVDYDDNTILCYDQFDNFGSSFIFLSKENGEILDRVSIPYEKKLDMDLSVTHEDGTVSLVSVEKSNMVAHKDGYLLTDHSNDTIYLYRPDGILKPVMSRTPPVQGMDPVIYVNGFVETNQYLFLKSIVREFDWDTRQGLSSTALMLDKETGKISRHVAFMNEWKGKDFVICPELLSATNRGDVGCIQLSLESLQYSLEKGLLSGKLKELVEELDEDGNDVIMLLHFKK